MLITDKLNLYLKRQLKRKELVKFTAKDRGLPFMQAESDGYIKALNDVLNFIKGESTDAESGDR